MKLFAIKRYGLKIHNSLFVALLLGIVALLAILSKRYQVEFDWTHNNRNTLSEASQQLLKTTPMLPVITVYATEQQHIRSPINDLLHRYQRVRPDLVINYVNPELEPDKMRELGIDTDGELRLELNGRSEYIKQVNEQNITNTMQRLSRNIERWLLFIEGHGERNPLGIANHDLGQWGKQLTAKGIKIRGFNIADNPVIPQNTSAIVIASPQLDYLPGEINAVIEYVKQGGNLLWLAEPGSLHQLDKLSELLGLNMLKGTIVDPNAQLLGINDPRFALVSQYPKHDLTHNFNAVTLFPLARAIKPIPNHDGWQDNEFLQTLPRSWSEVGEVSGKIKFDNGVDVPGPLTIGVALNRMVETTPDKKQHQQRAIVVGDGDFISNEYLGNGGNLNMSLNMVNWLVHDDQFIAIPAKTAMDIQLELSATSQIVIAFGFLVVIPVLLAASGTVIWYRRRRR